MIDFDGLYDISLRLAGKPPLIEDNIYVDLLLTTALKEIQSKFDFVLKGGTAILKAYFRPYRFSYDLDFSYFSSGSPKSLYKHYKDALEDHIINLGFDIVNIESDRHRSGGRVLVLKLMDRPENLKGPVKLSVSAIDKQPCFPPVCRKLNPIVKIPRDPYHLLYPEITKNIRNVNARVLTIEELCAEKLRALSTRGEDETWSLVLRDIVDLYYMEREGILDRVFKGKSCIIKKFQAIENKSYWKKYQSFLKKETTIEITDEDRAVFIKQELLNEKLLDEFLQQVKGTLMALKL